MILDNVLKKFGTRFTGFIKLDDKKPVYYITDTVSGEVFQVKVDDLLADHELAIEFVLSNRIHHSIDKNEYINNEPTIKKNRPGQSDRI